MEKIRKKIGFIINDAASDYCKSLTKGISDECEKNNCNLIVFPVGEFGMTYDKYGYQRRSVASFASMNNLDGLIVASATQGTHVDAEVLEDYVCSFSSIPLVSIGVEIPKIPSILVDCKSGLRTLIEHLIEKHHCKKFAFMTSGKSSVEAEERFSVFKQVLDDHNLHFDNSYLMYGFYSYELAYQAMDDYEKSHGPVDFDAIVCINDNMALGVIDYCKEKRIQVPEDLIVTGFDDILKTGTVIPTLSSINQQTIEQGHSSVRTVLRIIEGLEVPLVQRVPTRVRYRQSCGCVSGNDFYTNYQNENYTSVAHEAVFRNEKIIDWFEMRDQLIHLEYFFQNTQGRITMHEFLGQLQFMLADIDITQAALCLYETPVVMNKLFSFFPMPEKAFCLTAFNKAGGYQFKSSDDYVFFNPNETICPAQYYDFSCGKTYVISLSNCEKQYGYLIFKPGQLDEVMYDFACHIMGRWLASAWEYTHMDDNTSLKEHNRILTQMSRTDELTNLLNRRGFMELGQQSIDMALRRKQGGVVIFADMDGLKKINDAYGHEAGDKALVALGQILLDVCRKSDIIGRIGGDEFAIVSVGIDHDKYVILKEKIDAACKAWSVNSGSPYPVSLSLGYSVFNAENFALSVCLQKADGYLYKEKKNKKRRNH